MKKSNPYNIPKVCPLCGQIYYGFPALSRSDDVTEICPECGIREALTAFGMPREQQDEIIEVTTHTWTHPLSDDDEDIL